MGSQPKSGYYKKPSRVYTIASGMYQKQALNVPEPPQRPQNGGIRDPDFGTFLVHSAGIAVQK
jgi:hypothetical protein